MCEVATFPGLSDSFFLYRLQITWLATKVGIDDIATKVGIDDIASKVQRHCSLPYLHTVLFESNDAAAISP
jgi:hypothetical protein